MIQQQEVTPKVQQVFDSVNTDYTMIAQKSLRLKVLNALDYLCGKDHGFTFPELTKRF